MSSGKGNSGNDYKGNSRDGSVKGLTYPQRGGHHSARGWGAGRPVDMSGLLKGMNGLAVRGLRTLSNGQIVNCHDWKHDDLIHGHVDQDMVYGYAIAGACTVVQALHGIHEDVAWTNTATGTPFLKEVSFVVPSHLLQDIAGKIDTSITFSPARGDGLTKGQVRVKYNFQCEFDQITAGGIPDRCSMDGTMNNWVGDNKAELLVCLFDAKVLHPRHGFRVDDRYR
ncbi:uncharacterized protein RSE6_03886 [Rhynchosporium secalis]|uniref:Uncharacterized protein n=1 Tax=Rhynchosporium secalis TaxID=38038 RepID=A0A1E1M3W4_RHYSE|nr:uncharacterized protein RSE6_03886 [Rhynchosporium secalis]